MKSFSIRRLAAVLAGDWHDVGVIAVYAIGVGICSLVLPIAGQAVVSTVAFGTLLQPVVVLTVVVGAVLLISGILRLLQFYTTEMIQRRLVVRFGLMLSGRIPHVRLEKFFREFGPDYVLRFLEVFNVQKSLAILLLDGIALFFQVVIGLALVSFYHPIFLVFSIILCIVIVVILWGLGFGGVKSSIAESNSKYELVEWLQDIASIPTVFKSNAGEDYAMQRADALVEQYVEHRARHFRVVFRQIAGTLLLHAVASSGLLALGCWLVIKGQLTLGQLVAAEIVFSMVLGSITKLGKHLETFYDLAAGVAKLDSMLDLPFEELAGSYTGIREAPAHLRLEDITLERRDGMQTLLENASVDISPGEKIAIWGGNSTGKSYLADIIYRLAEPARGRVRLDEFNISTIHPKELRTEVSLTRGVEIFHGTIRDNLLVGRKDGTDAELRAVLKLVGLVDEVFALERGLDTWLSGTVGPLSRGQALRLMLARGILAKPRLLVVDGTLDLIDDEWQGKILSSLLSPEYSVTLVVLTHERGLLKYFARSYVIENTQLVENAG
jgi:ABC-type bacteriocin/lantibiotic exporter with double-glycine peptidase domain